MQLGQIARNGFWSHTSNVASLFGVHVVVPMAGQSGVIGLRIAIGGYGLSHYAGGAVALIALAIFVVFRKEIAPPESDDAATAPGRC